MIINEKGSHDAIIDQFFIKKISQILSNKLTSK